LKGALGCAYLGEANCAESKTLSVRPPRAFAPRPLPDSGPLAFLQQEMAAEQAAGLGAAYRTLVEALAALPDAADDDREARLDTAGEALFAFVVQRESCGLRNTEAVLRDLGVPGAVRVRMGVRRPRPEGSGS
jgi:hypothetical protein